MEERIKYEIEETPTEKFIAFIKQNILNFLLVVIYGVFIFKDMVTIQESGKSILSIIADSLIAWFMGTATSTIMRRKGQAAAMATDSYQKMQKSYNKEIERTDSNIDKLDGFCDVKNDQRIVKVQKAILRTERIKFDDFETKTIDVVCGTDKKRRKCWYKAQHAKIQLITPENLLSETDSNYDKGKKEDTLNEHNKKKLFGDGSSKILFALIFGYFTVVVALNANIFWSCIQVAVWLLWGIMSYLQEYFYIKQEYQNKIYRKINYLIEFNNTYVKKGVQDNGTNE